MEQHLKDMWKQERNSSWMVFQHICMLWKWSITERKLMWKGEGTIAGVMFLNPEYSLEGLMLKLKLQYFGHLMWRANSQKRQDPDAGKDWSQEEKGMTGWDGWMASLTQWTWVSASSGRWWRTGKPGALQSMGSQRVEHNWLTAQQCSWVGKRRWGLATSTGVGLRLIYWSLMYSNWRIGRIQRQRCR